MNGVVLGRTGLLDRAARQAERDALLALLAEVAQTAPAGGRAIWAGCVHTSLPKALPALPTFAPPLDALHQELDPVLGTAGCLR